MFAHLKSATARAARKAGILCGGMVCILVGAGFLTVSAWICLAASYDHAFAALVLGSAYLGIGLLVVGITAFNDKKTEPHAAAVPPPPTMDGPALVQAFLYGMQAGSGTEKTRPS